MVDHKMADFEIYVWNHSSALAPVFFLEEVRANYNLIPSNPEVRAVAKDLKKINPLGDVPVLNDRRGPSPGISVFGTSAILQYLAKEFDKLMPAKKILYATALQWLFWQEREIHGPIIVFESSKDAKVRTNCTYMLRKALKKIDTRLKNKSYIAEELSITDIALFFLIRQPEDYGILITEFPNIRNWMTRMNNRVATKRSLSIAFY